MYKHFLSFRFLRSRIISWLAILFTALGIGILVVVQCVMGGFEDEFRKSIRSFYAHIVVDSEYYWAVKHGDEIMADIRQVEGVVDCAPYIDVPMMISTNSHDYGNLRGIDPEAEARVSQAPQFLQSMREAVRAKIQKEWPEESDIDRVWGDTLKKFSDEKEFLTILDTGKTDLPGMVVGSEIFKTARMDQYRVATITAPQVTRNPGDEIDSDEGNFEVLGVFNTGNYEIDRRACYAHIRDVQDLIGADRNQLSGIAVKVVNDEKVDEVKDSLLFLKEKYDTDNLRIQTWMEKDKNLLQAVRLEKWLITAIIFMVLCLVTALIVALLTMSVVEKRRDIGILRSLGASGGGIMSIFLSQGLMIVIIGGMVGLILGLLVVANLNFLADKVEDWTGYHPFPKKIYYLDEIPTRVQFAEIATLVIALVLVSFTLSLFPAGRAVRINPIAALRYE